MATADMEHVLQRGKLDTIKRSETQGLWKATKAEIIKGYYTFCEIKHCYSCAKEKEAEMAAMKKYWDQVEKKEQQGTNHSQ